MNLTKSIPGFLTVFVFWFLDAILSSFLIILFIKALFLLKVFLYLFCSFFLTFSEKLLLNVFLKYLPYY